MLPPPASASASPSAAAFGLPPPPPPSPDSADDSNVSALIDSEPHHIPLSDYSQRLLDRSVDVAARQDSINWILRVHAHYNFKPVTAFLCVNYFDRFLSCHAPLSKGNGWAYQLLSVACLSIAAKMEEIDVPALSDLQVIEPRFVFEPGTVRRMELRVMATLDWRLRSVTPFDYLHCFISKLSSASHSCIFSASSDLIMGTVRVVDFLGFAPSTIAAAAVLCAAGESCGDHPPIFHRRISKEKVRSCRQLMEEYLVDTCPSARLKADEPQPEVSPPSPIGVLDAAACRSCDTRSEVPSSSGQAEPPPPSKRPRSSPEDVPGQP